MPKITPFLWFDGQAEQAAKFYVSLFKNSKILEISRYSAAGPGPKGSVMMVRFRLEGREFYALNAGPHFKFTEAVSFVVECRTQAEVDKYWKKLSRGGEESQCGWLKDKYGLSWQITPVQLLEMVCDRDSTKVSQVMQEMFTMKKLNIKRLQAAYKRKA